MKRTLIAIMLALALLAIPVGNAFAASTADVTVTAKPAKLSITVDNTTYDFGDVDPGATPSSALDYFTIDNKCTVITDNTVSVTTATWSGGVGWTHDDTCTPGLDTAGLMSHLEGGAWGDAGDVIVKNAAPNILANDQAKNTDWKFGLQLYAPTESTDDVQKSIIVRITAAEAS